MGLQTHQRGPLRLPLTPPPTCAAARWSRSTASSGRGIARSHPAKIFGTAKRAAAGRLRKLLKQDSGSAREVVKPSRRPDEFPLATADSSRPAFPRPGVDRRGEPALTERYSHLHDEPVIAAIADLGHAIGGGPRLVS
jgi:hypothetical protein